MTKAYVSAKLQDTNHFTILRDSVYSKTSASCCYKKVKPHITVIPPFSIKGGHVDEVYDIVSDSPLVNRRVRIKGLSVYKNIVEPYVVLLDVDVKMEKERERILNQLDNHIVELKEEPVNPHITLFKVVSWDANIPQAIKRNIQKEIIEREIIPDTRIKSVDVELQ